MGGYQIMYQDRLLKEYDVGTRITMHYETLRRAALVMCVTAQGAIGTILFGLPTPDPILHVGLSLLAVFIAALTINNDIWLLDYYLEYIKRLKAIENRLGMQLYSVHRERVWIGRRAPHNRWLFRGFAVISAILWALHIALVVASAPG
jgi:hypothetical protein